MTRRWIEVNATRGAFATCAALSIGACVLVGCGSDERRAERMHRLAIEELEAGNTDAAAAHLEEILERYPSTEAADRARARLKLVRGLHEAVEKYPRRRTQDAMVEIGRALERHRASSRAYPETLEEIERAHLPDGIPADGWGNAILYEVLPGRAGYRLVSHGADGAPGGGGEDRDVVVRSGKFVSGEES